MATIITVAIPAIDSKAHAALVDALLAEQVMALNTGSALLVIWERGCASAQIARNRLVRDFLEAGVSDRLVFVDADISWKMGDLLRLARREEDVIGGTYRAKKDDVTFHVDGPIGMMDTHGLWEVGGLPGGFLAVSRSALERMKLHARPYIEASGREVRDWFRAGFHEGRMLTEDYGFCAFWRDLGGSVFLDTAPSLKHWDGNRAYEGDAEMWLVERMEREAA